MVSVEGFRRYTSQKAGRNFRRFTSRKKQQLAAQQLLCKGFSSLPSLFSGRKIKEKAKLIFKCENCLSHQKWKRKGKHFSLLLACTQHYVTREKRSFKQVCGGVSRLEIFSKFFRPARFGRKGVKKFFHFSRSLHLIRKQC
jgi:hypothetical protein